MRKILFAPERSVEHFYHVAQRMEFDPSGVMEDVDFPVGRIRTEILGIQQERSIRLLDALGYVQSNFVRTDSVLAGELLNQPLKFDRPEPCDIEERIFPKGTEQRFMLGWETCHVFSEQCLEPGRIGNILHKKSPFTCVLIGDFYREMFGCQARVLRFFSEMDDHELFAFEVRFLALVACHWSGSVLSERGDEQFLFRTERYEYARFEIFDRGETGFRSLDEENVYRLVKIGHCLVPVEFRIGNIGNVLAFEMEEEQHFVAKFLDVHEYAGFFVFARMIDNESFESRYRAFECKYSLFGSERGSVCGFDDFHIRVERELEILDVFPDERVDIRFDVERLELVEREPAKSDKSFFLLWNGLLGAVVPDEKQVYILVDDWVAVLVGGDETVIDFRHELDDFQVIGSESGFFADLPYSSVFGLFFVFDMAFRNDEFLVSFGILPFEQEHFDLSASLAVYDSAGTLFKNARHGGFGVVG